MVHVIARMEIKDGQMERMLEILAEVVPLVRAEVGCIRYEVCQDADVGIGAAPNMRALTIVEAWESPKHLADHLATAHMASFRDKAGDLRENASVTVLSAKIWNTEVYFFKRAPTVRQALDFLYRKPVLDAAEMEKALAISTPTANKLIDTLREKNILVEITGQQRGRVYAFERYLNLFVS